MTNQHYPKEKIETRLWALLSYLGVFCLLPLFWKKDNAFVQFHARQGLVLFIVEIVAFFINVIPFLGQLIWLGLGLIFSLISIYGIVKVWRGAYWEMPILGEHAKAFKW